MQLVDRDYRQLSESEASELKTMQDREVVRKGTLTIRRSQFRRYPKAGRHFVQLFPNNWIDPVEDWAKERVTKRISEFRELLNDHSTSERSILNHIKERRSYFLLEALVERKFSFGGHGIYLFPEFQLGNSYRVDYLVAGKNSEGWHFVFIEFEAPYGNITLDDGDLGVVFRKGLSQLQDWRVWLEARYFSLKESFDKLRSEGQLLPEEFYTFDSSRVFYAVVAGRRADFGERTYRLRRQRRKETSEVLLHYDNLIDDAEARIDWKNAWNLPED